MKGVKNDIFTTEEKTKAGNYEVLEDRIVKWEWEKSPTFGDDQEPERERHSVRMRPWQESAVESIARQTGASKNRVRFCAFKQGIKVLREELDKMLWEHVGTIYDWAQHILGNYMHKRMRDDEVEDMKRLEPLPDPTDINIVDIQSRKKTTGKTVYIIPNDSEHIKNEYTGPNFVGDWFKRGIVSLGLSDSERIPLRYEKNASEIRDVIPERLVWQHRKVGSMMMRYINSNSDYWVDNGIHESVVSDMRIVSGRLVDMSQRAVGSYVEDIVETADILEHDPQEYQLLWDNDIHAESLEDKLKGSRRDYYEWEE